MRDTLFIFINMAKQIIIIDGENILFRFQAMLKNGRMSCDDIIYECNAYIWSPEIAILENFDVLRISYYSTIVGDDLRMQDIKNRIANIQYTHVGGSASLVPYLYKKEKQSSKNKSVDISIIEHKITLNL